MFKDQKWQKLIYKMVTVAEECLKIVYFNSDIFWIKSVIGKVKVVFSRSI